MAEYKLTLLQTEKSYSSQNSNVFVLVSNNPAAKLNKIECKKLLTKNGLEVDEVRVVNPPSKTKRRGSKGAVTIKKKRPQKFYVSLKSGTIDEEALFVFKK